MSNCTTSINDKAIQQEINSQNEINHTNIPLTQISIPKPLKEIELKHLESEVAEANCVLQSKLQIDSTYEERRTKTDRMTFEQRNIGVPVEEDYYINFTKYKITEEIGKGSYGVVRLGLNYENKKCYAIKMISKKRLFKRFNLNTILKKLNHPNIVKLLEVLEDSKEDLFCLVFEFIEKGPVINIPTNNPLSEVEACRYFRDVTLGVEYLHFQKIIHRDIKPSNLLLTNEGHIKIADFGISSQFIGSDAIITNQFGTPANSPACLGKPLDIWAMGVTLFAFLFGTVKSELLSAMGEFINLKYMNNLLFSYRPCVSLAAKDLISKLLTKDPTKRISIEDIKHHNWVFKENESDLNERSKVEYQLIEISVEEIQNSIEKVNKLRTLV